MRFTRLLLVTFTACVAAVAVAAASAEEADGPVVVAAKHTNILCLNTAGTRYVVRYRPRSCTVLGPHGAFAGGVDLKRIRWRSWNEPAVRGRARECGFHVPCDNVRVRIRAYRRRHACGRVVYTRLRATSKFGTTTVRLARCPRSA